jgi:hypothetical protein
MILTIDGQPHAFTPIQQFRDEYGLSAAFGVGRFLQDSRVKRGSMDSAGPSLGALREHVLRAVPAAPPETGWMTSVMLLQHEFQRQLVLANSAIGLQRSEIEFAVMGFAEVSQAFVSQALRAVSEGRPVPDFQMVYQDWLNTTCIVSHPFTYTRGSDTAWLVRVVHNAYGACGLVVQMPHDTRCLSDFSQFCPAESFMRALLRDVGAGYVQAMQSAAQKRR